MYDFRDFEPYRFNMAQSIAPHYAIVHVISIYSFSLYDNKIALLPKQKSLVDYAMLVTSLHITYNSR